MDRILFVVLFALAPLVASSQDKDPELEKLRSAYNAKVEEIYKTFDSKVSGGALLVKTTNEKIQSFTELTANYTAALDRLKEEHIKSKKLDFATEVQKERTQALATLEEVKANRDIKKRYGKKGKGKAKGKSTAYSARGTPSKGSAPPGDAVKWNGHSYKLFLERLTWHEAKEKCESMGGHLVTIDSSMENQQVIRLASLVPERAKGIWIGCTNEGPNRKWHWITGEPFTYQNWAPDRPSKKPRNNFGAILSVKPQDKGVWNNGGSRGGDLRGKGFVCEWDS